MARKKPAKKAKKKSAARPAARNSAKKTKKSPARAAKKAAKRSAPKRAAKPVRKPAPVAKKAAKKSARPAAKAQPSSAKASTSKPKGRLLTAVKKLASAAVSAGVSAALAPKKKPNLDRPRKTVADVHGIPSSLDLNRSASSAKSGRADMRDKLSKNNSGGAAITAGDVDADWQSAESIGDEAPGGDNPTPDQDRVDDIGRALGVEYADDEELQGGAEIADRDLNRWELDPASKDDFDEEED
jgi:hypothetical protein